MIKVRHGEHVLEAPDAPGLVTAMREASPDGIRSDRQFMRVVAHRAEVQSGKTVRTATAEEFIEDLIGSGLLEEVP
jgi:hypothetical protein